LNVDWSTDAGTTIPIMTFPENVAPDERSKAIPRADRL
jgi:hypothetical protein